MAGYMVKLIALVEGERSPAWIREPSWWDPRDLQNDPRFTERVNDGYLDYEAVLTAEEAWEFNQKYAGKAYARQLDNVEELRKLLTEGSGDFDSVLVQVLEWESGL